MKLAVLSDIHGNLTALHAVLAEVNALQPDLIWILGDLAAHGVHPAPCVAEIRAMQDANPDRVKVIGGNTDRYLVTNARMARPPAKDEETYQQYLQQFALESAVFDWGRAQLGWQHYQFLSGILNRELGENVAGYGYVLGYHAIPGDDEHNITADTPTEEVLDTVLDRPLRLGVYGHIHRQVNRDFGRVHLVNPGSVGMSFESPGVAQYALLTFAEGALNVDLRGVPYDVEAVLADAHAVGHPAIAFLEKILKEPR